MHNCHQKRVKSLTLPHPEMICDGSFFTSAQAGGPLVDSVMIVPIVFCGVALFVQECVRAVS